MCELDLYGTVDGAVCTLDGINHLVKSDDVKKTFQKISLFLESGSLFIFDVNTVYKHENVLANHSFVYDYDDIFCAWQSAYNREKRIVSHTLDFFEPENGHKYSRSREYLCERAYSVAQLSGWLEAAGFDVAAVYDDMTTSAPAPSSERLYFVARKM